MKKLTTFIIACAMSFTTIANDQIHVRPATGMQYACLDGVAHYKHQTMTNYLPVIHHIQQTLVLCRITDDGQFLVRPIQRIVDDTMTLSQFIFLRKQFVTDWVVEPQEQE